jgi:hypothetical protein
VLERHLEKTILRAPADGVVSVIVAEVGENVHAGQPVLSNRVRRFFRRRPKRTGAKEG